MLIDGLPRLTQTQHKPNHNPPHSSAPISILHQHMDYFIIWLEKCQTCMTRSSWRRSSWPFSKKAWSSPSLPWIVNFRGRCLDVMTTSWCANVDIVTTGDPEAQRKQVLMQWKKITIKCMNVRTAEVWTRIETYGFHLPARYVPGTASSKLRQLSNSGETDCIL